MGKSAGAAGLPVNSLFWHDTKLAIENKKSIGHFPLTPSCAIQVTDPFCHRSKEQIFSALHFALSMLFLERTVTDVQFTELGVLQRLLLCKTDAAPEDEANLQKLLQ